MPAQEPQEISILNTSVSDQAADKDSLGFAPYVQAIGEFLTNRQTKPPLTISVEGEWGSGKSSFMKQLRQEIEAKAEKQLRKKLEAVEKRMRQFLLKMFYVYPQIFEPNARKPRVVYLFLWRVPNLLLLLIFELILTFFFKVLKWLCPHFIPKPKTVWFNAWRHDKAESVWAAFALEFIQEISKIRGIYDLLPILCGHLKLFVFRIQWTIDALLDAFKTMAQLLLGIAAIITILIFSWGPESAWVVTLSNTIKDFQETIQKSEEPETNLSEPLSKEPETKPSNPKASSPSTQSNQKNTQTASKNPFLAFGVGSAGIGSSSLIVIALWKQVKKMVGDPKKELAQYLDSPNYQGLVAFVEKFHQDFKKIVDAYVGKDKVYVFIDDLDRCELPKSAKLMQALNLMISEDPSIIFILGMDREKVAAGLAVKYKDLLPYLLSDSKADDEGSRAKQNSQNGLEYGYAFIEKFVQLPFVVPQPSNMELETFVEKMARADSAQGSMIVRSGKAVQKLIKEIYQWWLPILKVISEIDQQRVKDSSSTQSATEQPTPSNKEPQQAEQRLERRSRIKLKVTEDSKTIRNITLMVASALDYNPRRLKHFINLFRLRTYIASDTGLFDEWINRTNGESSNQALTLEQLGKFVAINLRWPLLLADLEKNPNLFEDLENFFSNQSVSLTDLDEKTKYWGNRQKLKELIGYGLDGKVEANMEPSSDVERRKKAYGLATVRVETLLQVSPKGGRTREENQSFTEELVSNILLEMVAIPEGRFFMGSPNSEEGSSDYERPQHEVTVKPFFMSQYPITQAQWREIATLRPVNSYLNPEPSYFKEDNNPIENVSWYEAVEFCARLSRLTGNQYRLPSEAEWEYACRAGTTTPFYFGETITGDLANYNAKDTYANETPGKYRGKTTPVGQFPPNGFGLYDMHGNVWEWCADDWHSNYNGAPQGKRI
ncbi:MAG: SUMF1/EgtB/PvdO family nonheme iron enzyme [Crocosphaera sp.]